MLLNRFLFKLVCLLWSFDRAHFYRDLADALARKVGIRDFLERAASNARILDDGTSLRMIQAMSARLAGGQGHLLSELVQGIAPAADQLLLQAVDDAGADKAEALTMCASAVEFQQRALKVMAYQLLVPVVAIPIVGALCFITSQIISGIAASGTPDSIWTGYNGLVRWLADSINDYAAAIGVATAIAVAATVYWLPRWTGSLRLKIESWPGLSLYRDYNAAVVLSALAMMIRSGKTMREALEALRAASRPWLRWHLNRIITSLEDNPTEYITAFGRGLMPPAVRARLASLLDSAKSFADALVVLGTTEIDRLEKRVYLSASTVNWTLTGFFVAIAVVLSIGTMTIASALSREGDPSAKLMQRAQQQQAQ